MTVLDCKHTRRSLCSALGAIGAALVLIAQTGIAPVSAQCGPNPIVCENSLPGTPSSEWDIDGAGDPQLQGFATDISANKGDTVRFKVSTTATIFSIDIY